MLSFVPVLLVAPQHVCAELLGHCLGHHPWFLFLVLHLLPPSAADPQALVLPFFVCSLDLCAPQPCPFCPSLDPPSPPPLPCSSPSSSSPFWPLHASPSGTGWGPSVGFLSFPDQVPPLLPTSPDYAYFAPLPKLRHGSFQTLSCCRCPGQGPSAEATGSLSGPSAQCTDRCHGSAGPTAWSGCSPARWQ